MIKFIYLILCRLFQTVFYTAIELGIRYVYRTPWWITESRRETRHTKINKLEVEWRSTSNDIVIIVAKLINTHTQLTRYCMHCCRFYSSVWSNQKGSAVCVCMCVWEENKYNSQCVQVPNIRNECMHRLHLHKLLLRITTLQELHTCIMDHRVGMMCRSFTCRDALM